MFVLWVECTSTYDFCRFVLVSMHARVCVSVYVHVSAQLWDAKEGQGPRDKRGRLPAWLPWQRQDGKGSVGIAIKMESGAPLHAYTHTHTHNSFTWRQSRHKITHKHERAHSVDPLCWLHCCGVCGIRDMVKYTNPPQLQHRYHN